MFYKRPKFYKHLYLVMVASFFIISISCGSKRSAVTPKVETKIHTAPQIVFLNYAIKKYSDGKKTVQFLNSKKVEGKLKPQKKLIESKGISADLICSQLSADSSILSQTLIENPLQKTIEYIDDTKNFKVVSMELDSTEFTVRLQLYPETKYIAVNYSGSQKNPLVLTKVNEL